LRKFAPSSPKIGCQAQDRGRFPIGLSNYKYACRLDFQTASDAELQSEKLITNFL